VLAIRNHTVSKIRAEQPERKKTSDIVLICLDDICIFSKLENVVTYAGQYIPNDFSDYSVEFIDQRNSN